MTQDSKKFENGLNIHLLAFTLPKNLVKSNEEVRVSITTTPDGNKQKFHIQGKKMYCSNHVFAINISNETKRIVMVFRKRTIFSYNPIIASATIHLSQFLNVPKDKVTAGTIETDIKTLNIYYPIQKQIQEQNIDIEQKDNVNRKVIGQMQVQLSFTTPYNLIKKDKLSKNNKKNEKMRKNSKIKNVEKREVFEEIVDENEY
ncbi:hypothetical protein M9Y10_036066 [Tritrichomonas musculus]|uniref:MSP domain-containing protein n=1 Tax=Tritrichomonas musculus TaxID=1915356 RepID=A0ABR2GW17_9EUKA